MELLAQQAKQIKHRVAISERIYQAAIGFEPLVNHIYYIYETHKDKDVLSLIAPNEWGRSFPYKEFVAKVKLLGDHTWDVLEGEYDVKE